MRCTPRRADWSHRPPPERPRCRPIGVGLVAGGLALIAIAVLGASGLPFGVYANLGAPLDAQGEARTESCSPERFADFGYSKTAEETFRYWPRDQILADVTWVVRTFRPHIIDLFEPQDYPNDFQYEGGPPIAPYDNAGWTLAYQMGVEFDRILDGFDGPFEAIDDWNVTPMAGTVADADGAEGFLMSHRANDAFKVINRLEDLREYNSSLKELIEDQAREMTSLENQIGSATTIERS